MSALVTVQFPPHPHPNHLHKHPLPVINSVHWPMSLTLNCSTMALMRGQVAPLWVVLTSDELLAFVCAQQTTHTPKKEVKHPSSLPLQSKQQPPLTKKKHTHTDMSARMRTHTHMNSCWQHNVRVATVPPHVLLYHHYVFVKKQPSACFDSDTVSVVGCLLGKR